MGYSNSSIIVQLIDKTFSSFEKEQLILGVFIDLSTALETVIHSILLLKKSLIGLKFAFLIESSTFIQVKIAKQIFNVLLLASLKDLFLDHFSLLDM